MLRIPQAGSEMRFEAEIRPGWDIGGNANGGYLLAIAGRAMAEAVGRPPRDTPAEMPHYDDCSLRTAGPSGVRPELMDRLAVRIRPGDDGYNRAEPTGDPEMRGWFALAAEESIDVFALLLATDSFPPPMPGPLRCAFRSRFVADGLVDEAVEIWDSAGALVAQSRQLSLLPRG